MTLRDILCTACSDVALSVDESLNMTMLGAFLACGAKSKVMACKGCGKSGTIEQVDDGEQAMLVFRVEET